MAEIAERIREERLRGGHQATHSGADDDSPLRHSLGHYALRVYEPGRPEVGSLPRNLHGAQRVLGVLFRLVFVEERKDPPHHHAHRVFAQILQRGLAGIEPIAIAAR